MIAIGNDPFGAFVSWQFVELGKERRFYGRRGERFLKGIISGMRPTGRTQGEEGDGAGGGGDHSDRWGAGSKETSGKNANWCGQPLI